MLADRIEGKWIDAFCEIFERCAVKPGDTAAILSETQSRAINVHLAELALLRAALDDDMPVLGMCLGAQLLAVAAGGKVVNSGRMYAGWPDLAVVPGRPHDERERPRWTGRRPRALYGGQRPRYAGVFPP